MGNKMFCGFRRGAVDERFTRPQRLSRHPSDVDVDYKRLRKLILSRKLAPCFDAADGEDNGCKDLEECPICFMCYPSLNRSRCCGKGICTECFLQMKPTVAARPAQCPFCKTPCYAVEYRGARTEKEKCLEQIEEQKFIEAKIRMQSESDNVRQAMPMDQTLSAEVGYSISSLGGALSGLRNPIEIAEAGAPKIGESLEEHSPAIPNTCNTRHEEFPVDLEGIMMMEAIWQSLQDSRLQETKTHEISGTSNTVASERAIQGSSDLRPCSASSGQGESSLQNSLAECSTPWHQIPNIVYRRSRTHQGPYGLLFEESQGRGLEASYFASSSNSNEDVENCSINFASRLVAPFHSSLDTNSEAGHRYSHYSDMIIREQPVLLDTEAKA